MVNGQIREITGGSNLLYHIVKLFTKVVSMDLKAIQWYIFNCKWLRQPFLS